MFDETDSLFVFALLILKRHNVMKKKVPVKLRFKRDASSLIVQQIMLN